MVDHQAKAGYIIRAAMENIKDEDILHRGFLKPIEIALKTAKTQPGNPSFKSGCLAKGLKIAVRESYQSDKRVYRNFEEVRHNTKYDQLKTNNQDNILALMKRPTGIKLAICVCMFREDKKMLKATLKGIEQNIANLVAYDNLDPDEIAVFVMMDGIQEVDSSIVDYFEELERSSNINLGENIVPSLSMKEIADRGLYMSVEEIDQIQIKNVNNYLFDVAELQERNNLRFPQIKKEYNEIKALLEQVKKQKQGRPLFDDLHPKLKPYFFEQAKQQRKKDYAMTDEDILQQQKDELSKYRLQTKLHDDYALDISKARPLITKALQNGEQFCYNYISTRQDLAHLSCFRKKIPFSQEVLDKSKGQQGTRESIYEDQSQVSQQYTVMNLFMCVKYKNGGKLSSHNWFFNGFCQELRPQFAVLLDVGLNPEDKSLLKMYRYLQKNKRQQGSVKGGVGGVCGYMSIKIQKVDDRQQIKDQDVDFITGIINKFTDIQRTQQVQYHFAHLMDKGFEAAFGFIHVLPGAFSAYNMKAIVDYDKDQDDQLLRDYFKSIDQKLKNNRVIKSEVSISQLFLKTFLPDFINGFFVHTDPESEEAMLYRQNVYLAEDRILCMGIHKRGYDMSYLPDAYAEVDPIKTVHQLLGQRKRWINGSYFAFERVKDQLKEHQKQKGCEFFLNLQMIYLSLMSSLSYFAPVFFLFTVHISMQAFRSDVLIKVLNGVVNDPSTSKFYDAFVYTMDFIYVLLILTIVFLSLHLNNKEKRFIPYLYGISTIFGLFMICVFAVLIVDIFRGLIDPSSSFLQQNQTLTNQLPGGFTIITVMRWVLVGSVLVYFLPIGTYLLFFGKAHILFQILFGGFSFLFFSPTYLNILNIYSLCRIDDFSWGTKGLDSSQNKNENLKSSWRWIKYRHVLKYVIWNTIFGVIILTLGSGYTPRFFVTIVLVGLLTVVMLIKIILSSFYMFVYWCIYRPKNQTPRLGRQSSIYGIVKGYQKTIRHQISQHLEGVKKQYMKQQTFNVSFIQASRKGDKAKSAFKKQQQLQNGRSGIQARLEKKYKNPRNALPTIQEETSFKGKIQMKNRDSFQQKELPKSKEKELDGSVTSNAPFVGEQLKEDISPAKSSESFVASPTLPDKNKYKKKNSK